jgi:hypothetical protein
MFNPARNSRGHIKSGVGTASKSQALIGLRSFVLQRRFDANSRIIFKLKQNT